ncbi:MAG TPA: hypothetical protein VGQ71_05695, partial [Terriglobales bacterium]|nr:hypothetical protein [Terriglobales bacterium]
RSALSMLFGPSTADLSFRATPAVVYDAGQLTEHEASMAPGHLDGKTSHPELGWSAGHFD